eukprot:scaffold2890_cov57-Attheya_sp.AAC.3
MGAKPCPYNATKVFFHAEEIIRGDRRDPTSCLQWEKLHMNLSGFREHDLRLPWVSKVVHFDGSWLVAAAFITFVDDIHPTGPGAEWLLLSLLTA